MNQYKSVKKCCDNMNGETETILCKPNEKHYAKLVCKHCGRYIKWLADPKMDRAVEKRKKAIKKMLKMEELTDKQKEFLEAIIDKRFPTPRQLMFYNSLRERYLDDD